MVFDSTPSLFNNTRSSSSDPYSEEYGNAMIVRAHPLGMARANNNVNVEGARGPGLEPCIGLEFDSADDGREFYSVYATRVGFRTRTGQLYRSRTDGSVASRRFVCSKEGFQLNSRTGCPAFIRVQRRDSGKWVVDQIHKDHNHELGDVEESRPPILPQRTPTGRKSSAKVSSKSKLKFLAEVDDGQPCFSRSISFKRIKTGGDGGQAKAEPYAGLVFSSVDEAFHFYLRYADEAGFKTRIGQLFRSKNDGSITSRRFVCSKEGFQHPSRVGCGAFMRIKRQDSGTWMVDRLQKDHNHDLEPQTRTHTKSSTASKKFIDEVNGGLDTLDLSEINNGVRSNISQGNNIGSECCQELKSLMVWSLRETACKYIESGTASIEKYRLACEIMRDGAKKFCRQRNGAALCSPDGSAENFHVILFPLKYSFEPANFVEQTYLLVQWMPLFCCSNSTKDMCTLMNCGSENREHQDLRRHLNGKRDFTGRNFTLHMLCTSCFMCCDISS
ncbi:hypothetical protein D5086_019197 [Populus alba]|uniref:Uncharacterized protein n=1 Tax=Populus alba TaxID=43335 RepID=A0ACC4BGI3_POPAL